MKELNESMGTVDFIMSEDNQLYFLEINPNGEFYHLSKQCNYNIEKIIAEHLITVDNE